MAVLAKKKPKIQLMHLLLMPNNPRGEVQAIAFPSRLPLFP